MVNLHNLHKIKIPTIQVRLLAVMLIGVLFTSVAFAAGVRDYGQNPNRQCRLLTTPGGVSVADPTDWSSPPSGFGPASTLASDDTIPNCKRMEQITYTSDPTGSGTTTGGGRWRYTCAECDLGYTKATYSMPSTDMVDCVVTWEECAHDGPCAGLVCEGLIGGYEEYSETPLNHNVTTCLSTTNKCSFICKFDYYDKEGVTVVGGPKNCAPCPSGAVCTLGEVTCLSGHYLVTDGDTISGYTKTCPACPTVGLNNVQGKSSSGSTSITDCFIYDFWDIEDNIGTYQFTEDCYYTTNSGTAN